MKNKLIWLQAILALAPFAVLAALWNRLPARFPMHWNLRGEIDRWSSNRTEILILPVIALGVVAFIQVLPRLDPRLRTTLQAGDRMYTGLQIIGVALAALFNLIFVSQMAAAFGYSIPTGSITIAAILIVLAITGNYLGNLRPNYFVGLRTPWTLENDETWRVTHRLGGRLLFFGSLILLVLCLLLNQGVVIFLFVTSAVLFCIWTVLYSWLHFRKLKG